jgi:hypothetical protein
MLSEINNHQLSNIIKQTKSFSKIEFDTSKLPIRQREKIRNRFIEFYKWENGKLSPICIVANPNLFMIHFFRILRYLTNVSAKLKEESDYHVISKEV